MEEIFNTTGLFQSNYSEMENMTNCIVGSALNSTLENVTFCNSTISTADDIHVSVGAPTGCESGHSYVRWFGDVVVTPPIILFGVIGNVLSFIVLCMQKPYLTTTILLRYLAVIDTLILLACVPIRVIRQIQDCHDVLDNYHDIYALYIFRWGYPCMFVLRMAGTWTTTMLTVDRHIAVSKPLHASRIVTHKLAIVQICVVTVASILLALPTFFEFNIVQQGRYTVFVFRDFAKTQWYIAGYKVVLWFLVAYIIPIAIMVIFNVRLTINLRSAAKDRALLQRSASSDNARLNNSVTTIVVVVVVTFLVCNTMALVSHTLYSIERCFPSLAEDIELPRRYVSTISNVFVTLNSAVNFLIYCVCSRSFRSTFMRDLLCRGKSNLSRRTEGRHSSGSATTHLSLLSNGSSKKFNCSLKENSHYLLSKETNCSNGNKHENGFNIYG